MHLLERKTLTDGNGKTVLSPCHMECSECQKPVKRVMVFEEEDNTIWLCAGCMLKALWSFNHTTPT
jgi:hypothetical protein